MGSFSIWHWAIVLMFFAAPFAVLSIVPAWLVVKKAGYAGPLALLIAIPRVGLLALWLFAFADWPALSKVKTSASNAAVGE